MAIKLPETGERQRACPYCNIRNEASLWCDDHCPSCNYLLSERVLLIEMRERIEALEAQGLADVVDLMLNRIEALEEGLNELAGVCGSRDFITDLEIRLDVLEARQANTPAPTEGVALTTLVAMERRELLVGDQIRELYEWMVSQDAWRNLRNTSLERMRHLWPWLNKEK